MKCLGRDDFIDLIVFANFVPDDGIALYFDDIDLDDIFSDFAFIPAEDRLAHKVGSALIIDNMSFDNDSNTWEFDIVRENTSNPYCNITVKLAKEISEEDLYKYSLIIQLCINGDMSDRAFLDKIGEITGSSVWRCSYCGGIYGHTYNDCLAHEQSCPKNPDNKTDIDDRDEKKQDWC